MKIMRQSPYRMIAAMAGGAITAPTYAKSGGGYAMRPQAAFYGRTDLSYVPFIGDTCLIAQYADSAAVSQGLVFLNAGDFLQTAVSGRVDSLVPLPQVNIRVYTFPIVTGIPFTPGDTLTVDRLGNLDINVDVQS